MKSIGRWWSERPEAFKYFQAPLVGIALSSGFVALLPILTLLLPTAPQGWAGRINRQVARLGTYGDMFGMLNAMFSGIAFCAIYYTLRIQQKQHDIQQRDSNVLHEVADLQIDKSASREPFETIVRGGDPNLGDKRPWVKAKYARIALINHAPMPARKCKAVLTGIKKRKPGGKFVLISESRQSLRLLHFAETEDSPENKTFTISHGIPEYFNVCSIKQEDGNLFCLIQVSNRDNKYKILGRHFELKHDYIFYITIDSENSPPLGIAMYVSMGDKLDEFTIKLPKKSILTPERVYAK